MGSIDDGRHIFKMEGGSIFKFLFIYFNWRIIALQYLMVLY